MVTSLKSNSIRGKAFLCLTTDLCGTKGISVEPLTTPTIIAGCAPKPNLYSVGLSPVSQLKKALLQHFHDVLLFDYQLIDI